MRAAAAASALSGAVLLAGVPSLAEKKKKEPPPLPGQTYDFKYDAKDVKKPERAYDGRAFVPTKAAGAKQALPALVFVHGLNAEKIPFRWMGGGSEGDVRRIVGELVEAGKIGPVLVLAPSTTIPSAITNAMSSWPGFDLDNFLALAQKRLDGVATIDRKRVFVAGHSGGGCNASGGMVSALGAKEPPAAAFVIDVCMTPDVAKKLSEAPPSTHVVVSYQSVSWSNRGFGDFQKAFDREVAKRPAGAPSLALDGQKTALRVIEKLNPNAGGSSHDAMVSLVLGAWLPKLAPPPKAAPAASASAAASAAPAAASAPVARPAGK